MKTETFWTEHRKHDYSQRMEKFQEENRKNEEK